MFGIPGKAHGGLQAGAADPVPAQALVLDGLADVAAAVGREDAVPDVGLRRQLQLMVSSLDRLLTVHALDAGGHCLACGRRRPCPAAEVLGEYVRGWLASGHVRRSGVARHAATPDTRVGWPWSPSARHREVAVLRRDRG